MKTAKEKYREKQSEIREQAMAYQHSFAEGATYYWSDIAEIGDYFEEMGKRYGLLKEFRENGII